MRSKGNISKIHYYLPRSTNTSKLQPPASKINSSMRKQSTSGIKESKKHLKSVEGDDMSFQIINVHQNGKQNIQIGLNSSQPKENKAKQGKLVNEKVNISKILQSQSLNVSSMQALTSLRNSTRNVPLQPFPPLPSEHEYADFLKFVQGLKDDANYQNTVTMFTVMYYYEKKGKK